MAEQIGLFEAMDTMRAMRRLRPDQVPEKLLWRVLEAATKAPNGANLQAWHFVVVREPEAKRFVQEHYQRAFMRYVEAGMKAIAEGRMRLGERELDERRRIGRAGMHLAEHLAEVPVLLFACIDRTHAVEIAGTADEVSGVYASIYPAVQNILLACRALGLGAVLTTLHLLYEDEIKGHLGIPPHVHAAAMIPIGYPRGSFGPLRRRPPEEVAHWERWGRRRERPRDR